MKDPKRPSPWLAVLGGLLLVGGLAFIVRANLDRPASCDDTEVFHPVSNQCVPASSYCEQAFGSVPRDEIARCRVDAPEGSVRVQIELRGTGDAVVRLTDGAHRSILEERFRLTYGLDTTLRGAAGEWTLATDFSAAHGEGYVRVWA